MKVDKKKAQLAMARAYMNAKDLAVAAGISYQTIRQILNERNTRPDSLGRIAKALGVDVTEIMKEETQ